jgi:hypothetical protein
LLNYEEYFLIKGCQNIQNLKEYKQGIQNRQNVMAQGIDAADLFMSNNLQPDSPYAYPGRTTSKMQSNSQEEAHAATVASPTNTRQTLCFNTRRPILVEDVGVRMNNSMNIECILEF